MVKLSETLVRKFTAYLAYAGDSFGYAPDNQIPAGSLPLWCDVVMIDTEKSSFPLLIPYSVFVVRRSLSSSKEYDDFYFFIHSAVYRVKPSLRSAFSFNEIVLLLYLAFERHVSFNL